MNTHHPLFFVPFISTVCTPAISNQSNDNLTAQKDSLNEQPAKFPGGEEAWVAFIEKNIDNNIPARLHAPPGNYIAVVSFAVEKDGTVSQIKILENPGYGIATELQRVIKKSPGWIPATQNGKVVLYRQKQSATFTIFVSY